MSLKFSQCLLFVGINLVNEHETLDHLELLLSKSSSQFLDHFGQSFRRPLLSMNDTQCELQLHTISLCRRLLEFAGGRKDSL